jgi:hypothetical protein
MTKIEWAVEQPDFRMTAPELRFHRGKAFWVRQCEELIGGRWEGFISMEPAKNATEKIQ